MVRRLIAGTAVFGALTLGAGVVAAATPAGAATSKAHKAAHRSHKSDKAAFCARIKKLDARVQARQGKVSGFITAVQQGESALAASGNTTQPNALAQGVKWIQSHESKVNARLNKALAKCTKSGSSSNTSNGSGSTGGTSASTS